MIKRLTVNHLTILPWHTKFRQEVDFNHGAVLTGLLPLVTAGVAVARAGERPSSRYWACSLVGLGAVVWFALGEGGGSLHLADLLLLGGVLAAAVGYNEGALLAREMPGWQVVSWALVLAAPLTVGATAWAIAAAGQLVTCVAAG